MSAEPTTPVTDPEREIARDMARRIALVSPVVLVVCGLFWGIDGAISGAVALVIVALNFLAAAGLMRWGARISPEALMGAVMFGYILRLAVITAAVLLIKDLSWVELVPLGFTLVVTHLGVLVWETRYVSGTLAYPGLRPTPNPSLVTKLAARGNPIDQEAERS